MKVYIGPFVDEGDREINVEIDDYDTWNCDDTMAIVILPLLKRLGEGKQGTPWTREEDAPQFPDDPNAEEHDRGFNQARWDWIFGEMVWAFEQITDPDHDDKFYTDTGNPSGTFCGKLFDLNELVCDKEGLRAHEERISNGLRLFGTYFRSLWC